MQARFLLSSLTIVALALISGCNDDSGTNPPPPPNPPLYYYTTLVGNASLGPIRQAVVTVYAFDGGLGDAVAVGVTDQNGDFRIENVRVQSVAVCVSGNPDNATTTYTEEASGAEVVLRDIDNLCSVRNPLVSDENFVEITAVTHMAYGLAQYLIDTGMPSATAVDQANKRVGDLLNTTVERTMPARLTQSVSAFTSTPGAIRYGAALAAISQYMAYLGEQQQMIFSSYYYARAGYDDIRYDGLLNGQGEQGALSFGGAGISPETYRRDTIERLFVFLASDRNQSGLAASDFVYLANHWNSSTDPFFANEPVKPFDNTQPIITDVSIDQDQTLFGTVTLSASATDIYGLQNVRFFLDANELAAFTPNDTLSYSLDTFDFVDGAHTLSINALNYLGGENQVDIPVTFNNAQTVIANIQPLDGAFLRGLFTVTADVNDPQGISSVKFYLNNNYYGSAQNVNSPSLAINSQSYPDGEHPFYILATNGVGFDTASDPVMYTFDNTSPSAALVNIANGDTLLDTFSIEFTVSDNIELSAAELLLDGETLASYSVFATPPAPHDLNTVLYSDGSHAIAVTANDRAGNNTITTRDVVFDNNPPSVTITNPVAGVTLTSGFTIAADTADTVGVTDTEYYVDTTLLANPTVNPAAYSDGGHSITVTAYDGAGHSSSDTVNVTFDTTPPSVVITNPIDGSYQLNDFTITADVSDTVGVAEVKYFVDSNQLPGPSVTATDYSDDYHTIQVQGFDVSGLSSSATVEVFIDNTDPSVVMTNPLEGDILSGNFVLRANVSDASGIDQVEFLIDDLHLLWADPVVPARTVSSASFSNGPHKFSAKVWDNAGRVSQADVNVTISN